MIVQVGTSQFKKATCYDDSYGCPLFQALSEALPGQISILITISCLSIL